MIEPQEGAIVDGFMVGRLLYAGAMAQIFEVTYADGRKSLFPMVMKVPKLSQGDGAENVTSFEVELQMLEVLQGEHVPRFVAAADMSAPIPYLVIEHIRGQTLAHWMQALTEKPFELRLPDISRVMSNVAQAVYRLHEQNACHLDLKPANIMVSENDRIVLLDFGLSFHGDSPDLLAEEFRAAVGSPAWISPEQVVGVRGDPRSDIFAVGVMLYELACGELPFGSPDTPNGLRNRLWMSPTPPRAINPLVPKWLQEITLRCLQVKAEDRYSSAAMLAFDLRHPEQLAISSLGDQMVGTSIWQKLKRLVWSAGIEYKPSPLPKTTIKEVPIVMLALPDRTFSDDLSWSLSRHVARALGNRPGARLVVITVLRSAGLSSTEHESSETTLHRRILARMQRWALGVDTTGHQISFHVLDSDDIAGALLSFDRENYVDLIIMGAYTGEQSSGLFATNVPIRVASEANCTVTLVREHLPFEHLRRLTESQT